MKTMRNETVTSIINSARSDRLQSRLQLAKRAFTTRHADLTKAERLVRDGVAPRAGDLVLARVISVGQHARIENIHGRRGALYIGDEIIVAFGNRYAPDQFEAFVPNKLGECDLVAGGGVASEAVARHAKMRSPTRIETIGLLARADGTALNLADFASCTATEGRPPLVIAVVGSSMNAGKTTTVGGLVHGLARAGFNVGAAKLTGTGSGGDLWTMTDAGAALAVDFTDAGHASTFGLSPRDLVLCTNRLLAKLADAGVDVAVVEIADGLLQQETAALIDMSVAAGWFDQVLFAAGDAMGAAFGVEWLARRGITAAAVSGLVSASPLAAREAQQATGTPIATLGELRDPVAAAKLAFGTRAQQVAA
jgi:hypothetical protein